MNSLDKTTRLYRALSEINQAIIRLEDEELLFPLVCEICVEYGGMALAWIGHPDTETGRFVEVVSRGKVGYLQGIVVSGDPNVPEGNGPSGICWRTGESVINNDYTSPATKPWRLRAKAFGLGSNASFPIMRAGNVVGVLAVYHHEPNAFDSDVVGLIKELVSDVSFALDNFDRLRDIEFGQQMLLARERHFRAYFDSAMVGMAAVSKNGTWIEANSRFLEMVGFTIEEITAMKWDRLTHPDDKDLSADYFSRMVLGELNFAAFDKRYVHKDGSTIYAHITSGAVRDQNGDFEYVVSTVENTTEKVLEGARLEQLGRSIDESLNEIYMFHSKSLKFDWVNRGAEKNLGYTREELLGMTPVDIKPEFDEKTFRALLDPLLSKRESQIMFVTCHERKDGSRYPVEIRLQLAPHLSSDMFIAVVLDISARQEIEAKLNRAASLFTNSREGIVIFDQDNKIATVNAAFSALIGYSEHELIGKEASVLLSDLQTDRAFDEIWSIFMERGIKEIEVTNTRKDGSTFINHVTMTEIVDSNGEVQGFAGFCRDVTIERQNEDRIKFASRSDALTMLWNRDAFSGGIDSIMPQVGQLVAQYSLILVNLDNFKQLNELHGYVFGDKALIEVGRRLSVFEAESVLVCRVGGDEFALAVPGSDVISSMRVARRALDAIGAPFNIDGHVFRLRASVGIAHCPTDANDLESIFRLAGSALTRSKQEGRNQVRLFDAQLNESYSRTLLIQDSLRSALEKNQLFLVYQPLISLLDGKVYGCEALLRWNHPDLGFVPPFETIRVAEDTGFILELGDWVLETAVRQLATWRSQGIYFKKLALNVSAFQFLHGSLVENLSGVLESYSIPASHIDLEITETVAMDNLADVINQIGKLRDLGVSISIDDFGTGYSSLSYLRKFQVSNIKIDRTFVEDVCHDREVRAIVEAIIRIAKVLGVETIAEGVETVEQLEMMRDLGCEHIQGFLFSKPLPEGDLGRFIERFKMSDVINYDGSVSG